MSINKNLVVAGFTLALLVASSYGDFPGAMASSYGGMAGNFCYETTETECKPGGATAEETCRTTCLGKGDSYIGGYCSRVALCVCMKKCAVQFPRGAAGLGPASA